MYQSPGHLRHSIFRFSRPLPTMAGAGEWSGGQGRSRCKRDSYGYRGRVSMLGRCYWPRPVTRTSSGLAPEASPQDVLVVKKERMLKLNQRSPIANGKMMMITMRMMKWIHYPG